MILGITVIVIMMAIRLNQPPPAWDPDIAAFDLGDSVGVLAITRTATETLIVGDDERLYVFAHGSTTPDRTIRLD